MVDALTPHWPADAICTVSVTGFSATLITPTAIHMLSGRDQPANTARGDDPVSLWLSPGRVLVVGFTDATPPAGNFVSDLTHGQAVFRLTGAALADILAMGTSLDPALLAPGHCAQTLFAGVKTLLYRHGEALHLHVDRPLAAFVAAWLAQAATALEGFSPS